MRHAFFFLILGFCLGCGQEPKPELKPEPKSRAETKPAPPPIPEKSAEQIALEDVLLDVKGVIRLFDDIPTMADFKRNENKIVDKISRLPDGIPRETRKALRDVMTECWGMARLGELVVQSGNRETVGEHRQKLEAFQTEAQKKLSLIRLAK